MEDVAIHPISITTGRIKIHEISVSPFALPRCCGIGAAEQSKERSTSKHLLHQFF